MRFLIVAAFLLLALPTRADDGPPTLCGPIEAIDDAMKAAGAELVAGGIRDDGFVMMIYADDGGRWAMVIRDGSGGACVVITGGGWRSTGSGDPT